MNVSHRVSEMAVSADGDWLTPLVNTWNEVASYIPESVKASIASALPSGALASKEDAAQGGASGRSKDLVLAVSFDVSDRLRAKGRRKNGFSNVFRRFLSGDSDSSECAASLVLDRVL
jgi:hypothetical protein